MAWQSRRPSATGRAAPVRGVRDKGCRAHSPRCRLRSTGHATDEIRRATNPEAVNPGRALLDRGRDPQPTVATPSGIPDVLRDVGAVSAMLRPPYRANVRRASTFQPLGPDCPGGTPAAPAASACDSGKREVSHDASTDVTKRRALPGGVNTCRVTRVRPDKRDILGDGRRQDSRGGHGQCSRHGRR